MKILRLTAENVKKLRAVQITPDGAVVTISGRNGAGKTSVLDSIWWALAGTKSIQDAPIRKGETKARIRLELGDLIVERKFSESGSTLSVESADGARFPSPQKMLDALLGELAFDPLAFARMEPRKQFDELRRIAKVDIDIDRLNAETTADYAARTELNREARAKRTRLQALTIPPAVEHAAVDEAALVDQLQQAGATNADIAARVERRRAAETRIQRLRADGAAARERADRLRVEAAEVDSDAAGADREADEWQTRLESAGPLPEVVDTHALREKIDHARATNAAIAARASALEQRQALLTDAEKLETQAHELTTTMEERDKAKADAIAGAQMPVPGLGFGAGAVTYNGLPFDQASSAEQLRVSMAIAMAANPKLRVIRITDGSLLDEDSLTAIADMAGAGDFQVWIEQVSSSGTVGIVIDDGAVASTPESRAAARSAIDAASGA